MRWLDRVHWLNGHGFERAPGVGGQGSLVCSSSWAHKELNPTKRLWTAEPSKELMSILSWSSDTLLEGCQMAQSLWEENLSFLNGKICILYDWTIFIYLPKRKESAFIKACVNVYSSCSYNSPKQKHHKKAPSIYPGEEANSDHEIFSVNKQEWTIDTYCSNAKLRIVMLEWKKPDPKTWYILDGFISIKFYKMQITP